MDTSPHRTAPPADAVGSPPPPWGSLTGPPASTGEDGPSDPPDRPPRPPSTSAGRAPGDAPRRRGRRVVPVLTVALSLGAGFVGGTLVRQDGAATVTTTTADPVSLTLAGDTLDVAGVVDQLEASVVSIETSIVSRRGPMEVQGEGAGTGIVLDDGR